MALHQEAKESVAEPTGPRGRAPDHATTFEVSLESLGYDVTRSERDIAVDISGRGRMSVTVRTYTYAYKLAEDSDEIRRVPFDSGTTKPLDRCPEWLSAVLRHVGVEWKVQ